VEKLILLVAMIKALLAEMAFKEFLKKSFWISQLIWSLQEITILFSPIV
jgi:hypothetical protein